MGCKDKLLGLALLAAAGCARAQGAELPADVLFERLSPSVWTVETFDANNQPVAGGSAVVIGPGSLVTNCHVLAKSRRVTVARENVSYGATLEHPDPERDLCLLKVRNFHAPAVAVAGTDSLKVGSRVYAIGSPRGLEQTISDGLLSGLRRSGSGELTALQITVPISKGSSGGGLFDARGRLIGITTFMLRDAQNVNFALPATWIAEVPARGAAALAARDERKGTATASAAGRPQVFEYRLHDKLTRKSQPVIYRLERTDGDKLFFNGGSRVESTGGAVVTLGAPIGGEFDAVMPPGGWIRSEPQAGAAWSTDYRARQSGSAIDMKLSARTLGEATMRVNDRELRTVQVEFTGYTMRGNIAVNPTGRYKAMLWYAPELGRVVRFEARGRGGVGGGAFVIDEVLELVDIRTE